MITHPTPIITQKYVKEPRLKWNILQSSGQGILRIGVFKAGDWMVLPINMEAVRKRCKRKVEWQYFFKGCTRGHRIFAPYIDQG